MINNKILEIRFYDDKYISKNGIRFGQTLEEVEKLLENPKVLVQSEEPGELKDNVIYKNINGEEGHCYYESRDKNLRIFFSDNIIVGLYITRDDARNFIYETMKTDGIISRRPEPADFYRDPLLKIPQYDITSTANWQVDLRSYDLTHLDLSNEGDNLMFADFDTDTVWPDNINDIFPKDKIMELGKSPGLNIKKLHDRGINGEGVSIAIIDQPLLIDHEEYKDQIRYYGEFNIDSSRPAQMHGPAVASIAVGKSVGVAPKSDLYYIAEQHGEWSSKDFAYDFKWLAKSIDEIIDVNKWIKDEKNKIRVISISVGWNEKQEGYEEVTAAVERAKENGIFVVSSSLYKTYGYFFHGLGRNPIKDPNDFDSYEPGLWWNKDLDKSIEYYEKHHDIEPLLIPMDSRTTAAPIGEDDYVFYRNGGWSWSIPYIAGVYALACQVDADITPDVFWEKALETGKTFNVKVKGEDHDFGKIINPVKLIESIENMK